MTNLSSCQVLWPLAQWYWSYKDFNFSLDLTRVRDQRFMCVRYYPAKFGGHRHSGSRGTTFFSLSHDLDLMTSAAPAWLVPFESNLVDVPACQIGRAHRSYRNRNMNSYINSYMDTSGKAKLTASIRYIGGFLKSGIPIYNSKAPDMAGRKARRRRTYAIAKRCVSRKRSKTFCSIIILYFKEMRLSV